VTSLVTSHIGRRGYFLAKNFAASSGRQQGTDCCNRAGVAESTRRIDVPATRNRWFTRYPGVQTTHLLASATGDLMMLKTTHALRASSRLKTRFDVEIAGIAIAVPDHALPQADAAQRAKRLFPDLAEYESPFRNTGIETRYTCQPAEWYEREHGWQERTDVFVHHALDLLEEVARSAIGAACIELKDIGAIVVNTITGLAIPSLDAKLMNRLDLPESVERLPIFSTQAA
jgi:hypothetical protein